MGVLAVGAVVIALLASALVQASRDAPFDSERPSVLRRRLLDWTAAGALTGTFLALMAVPAAEDASVDTTAVVSDLATVGALLGLAACIPTSILHVSACLRLLRLHDLKAYAHLVGSSFIVAASVSVSLGLLAT